MTAPRFVDCRCGHPKDAHHDQHAGMCVITGCHCLDYRPRTLAPAAERGTPTLRDLLAAGRRSAQRSTVALAERAEAAVRGLTAALREEQQRAAQAPAARAAAHPVTASGRRRAARDKRCDVCGKDGLANLGAHRFHAHGIRKTPPTEGARP